jgi:hypothetical protein
LKKANKEFQTQKKKFDKGTATKWNKYYLRLEIKG